MGTSNPIERRVGDAMQRHVVDDVGGVAWLVDRGGEVVVGNHGVLTRGEAPPVEYDTVFRIASLTKPIVAVAALTLVEECVLRLDEPVDDLLPELADRRVLVDPRGPVDGPTVPAARAITLADVLTFRLGIGMDFDAPWPQPMFDAMDRLEINTGPPRPQTPPEPDEWMRRLSTLPLQHQPGDRWLYNTGSDVLGVLVSRAAGAPLDRVLRDRVLDPLGMVDTAFACDDGVGPRRERLGTCYGTDPTTGERFVYDPPDGEWAQVPAFPSGAGGLVSTVGDLHGFARMLLVGGRRPDGERLLSSAAVEAMTSDQLGVSTGAPGPAPDGSQGWGYGLGVQLRRDGLGPSAGAYGWTGGLGAMWANDPRHDLVGIVLTTDMFTAPVPLPTVMQDFWTTVAVSLDT